MIPPISVCVPTFNAAKYLRNCLDSILAQTFTDFELLIVDNQSSDETPNIIKEYADRDSRIRIVTNDQNIGAIRNFNRCLELAKGEWIKYVHADDFIAPECLERMLAVSKPKSSMICCRRDFLFEPGVDEKTKNSRLKFLSDRSIDSLFPNLTEISASDYCNFVIDNFWTNIVGEPTAVMINRKAFYRFGVFNINTIGMADIELWARIIIHSGLTYIPQTLAKSRVHGESLTSINHTKRHFRNLLDRLVIFHDFAFHPLYAQLRAAASSHKPPLNYRDLLTVQAYRSQRLAQQSISDSSIMQEWENIISLYPMISTLSNSGTSYYRIRLIKKIHDLTLKFNSKFGNISF